MYFCEFIFCVKNLCEIKSNNNMIIHHFVVILVKDAVDYQGRSYLHIPKDLDIRLDTTEPPERCYLPKRHIHTW